MIEFDISVIPQGDRSMSRQIVKVQISNEGHVSDLRKKTFPYEIRIYDGNVVDRKQYRSARFRHAQGDDLLVLIEKGMKALLKAGILSRRRIPPEKYVVVDGSPYVTMDLVQQYHTPVEVGRFCDFMYGQTSCIHGLYVHDYERWLKQGRRDAQLAHDWD